SLTFQYTGFGPAHAVSVDLDPITVKYHLFVETDTDPGEVVYVSEKVNGSITVITTKWNTTLETNYEVNNFTADFLIPVNELNIEIYQFMDSTPGTELQLFEISQINYTFFWSTEIGIDHQQEIGSYTLKLRWTSPEDFGEETTVYLADDQGSEYEYKFTVSEGTWEIVNLTANHNFSVGLTENVTFNLKVVQTGSIVNYARNLTVDGGYSVVFVETTYEYRISVTPTSTGLSELIIRWENGTELGRVTYNVVDTTQFVPESEPVTEVEVPISNLDFLAILGVIVTIIVLAVSLFKFLPRY
ncbi:MAG: hypothetical protein ACTSP4_10620, partial [Candidatus Hodarchaeales archaeon]